MTRGQITNGTPRILNNAMLTTELKSRYNLIIVEIVKSDLGNTKLAKLIEAVDDPVNDLIKFWNRDRELLKFPKTWIDLVRLLRFSIVKNAELNSNYETTVNAYKTLTNMNSLDVDQTKLKEEISLLMYKIDEYNGNHERLMNKILVEMAGNSLRVFGRISNPDLYYSVELDDIIKNKFDTFISEIIELLDGYDLQIQISESLKRMIDLLL